MQDVVIQHLLLGEPSLAVQMVVHQACYGCCGSVRLVLLLVGVRLSSVMLSSHGDSSSPQEHH